MKIPLTVLLGSLGLLGSPGTVQAQTRGAAARTARMETDLPDETEETSIIDPGCLQVETAILHNRYADAPSSTIGLLMVRYGVNERLEVRALLEDGRRRDLYTERTVQATYPLAVSAKYVLLKDAGALPDVSLSGYLRLPFTNRNAAQSGYWSPSLVAAFQHQSGDEHWKLEYNIGGQQEPYGRKWAGIFNTSIHYQFDVPVEIFAEYFGQFEPGGDPQHNAGGGISWQLGRRVEIYAAAGTSLNAAVPNWFGTGGIACRF